MSSHVISNTYQKWGGEKYSLSKSFSRSLSAFNQTANLLIASSLLLGATALPSQAVVTSFGLSQSADYVQTSDAQPVSGSFSFFSSITYTDLTDLSVGEVFYNDVQSSFLLGEPLPSVSGFFVGALFDYSTRAELEAVFPDGTDYIYTISGGTLGTQAAVLDPLVSARRFVDDVPFLTGTTYSQLQGLDPSQPFTVNFNGTSFDSIPEVFNFKSFSIFNDASFESSFFVSLDPSDTSTLLPANTLAPNTSYSFSLGYARSTFGTAGFDGNAGFDGANSFGVSFTTTIGSFTTGSIPPGTNPEDPLLPILDPENPDVFTFPDIPVVPDQIFFFDPDVAVGYDYTVTGGPLFASVLIPNSLPLGDDEFLLELGSFGSFSLFAGTEFDLLAINPLGFDSFRISGIDANEQLDPLNPLAFVTGLGFTDAGRVTVTQTPIIQNTDPVSTPEPSSIAGLGILGGGLLLKRRRK
ncbi:hypothetical protein NIES3804_41950 [Microcystis aeruginosa NIES-3804]|uniref:PEP-CTERM protein-sorting domain-containing protein n=1 Tax=Microcystis aeruginosa NIES-3804 TaxID=2517783 RepID=A0A6H9GBQ8_MICAE|nr:PEP-CTERM sorting domain-containing protein [Microcystis aeruginosa]GCL52601.1 hypothetical protein NIES3804_41950 [Microcystis aeruginosa NIES-3804]